MLTFVHAGNIPEATEIALQEGDCCHSGCVLRLNVEPAVVLRRDPMARMRPYHMAKPLAVRHARLVCALLVCSAYLGASRSVAAC